MSISKKLLTVLVLLVLLIISAAVTYHPFRENPDYATLAAAANDYDVEILRDKWGVPHIIGNRDADVSFGLAYAHAEDDFETIQETLAATRGHLAQYRGSKAAVTDYIVRFLGVWNTIETSYDSGVPADVKAIAEAYVAGLNLYAARNPEKTWPGLAPFKAEDVVAGFIFKTPFFYGLDKELLRLFDDQRTAEIAIDPAAGETAFELRQQHQRELGSNAMAVRKHRSGDNSTRLLINSHQPMTGPVAWYEAHLISKESFNISGGLFPGTPVVLHGYTPNLAWANTVNHIDLSDSYALKINPANELQYELDGQWHDFEVEEVELMVKIFGPFKFPAKRRVLRSKHGPVVEGNNGLFALRYAGLGEVRQLEQYVRLNQATDFASFNAAMAMNALPSINYVYADKEDNIAFIHNAQLPMRASGWDWRKDMPGNRSDLIWQRYHDYAMVPKLVNPESGLLFNANNTPFTATDGSDNLRAMDFPPEMGFASNQTNRSLRFMELNDGDNVVGRAQILRQKFDLAYSPDSEQIALLKKILSLDLSATAHLQQAQQQLSQWDYLTNKENTTTALAVLSLRAILRGETPEDHSEEALRAALDETVDYLKQHFGTTEVAWGELNRLVRGDVEIALDGGPDILRAIYSLRKGDDDLPYATHGDTWMALVEWNSAGELSAEVAHQYGSATLDSTSPHYSDQAGLFARKAWRKALVTEQEVRANAVRAYKPNSL